MRDNPFSPSFSIRPERFYGRERELDTMREALRNPDSPNRFLFTTGTRGCGKTSLLHQYANLAGKAGWTTFETTYRDCLEVLLDFAGARISKRRALALSPSVSVAGVSASAVRVEAETAEQPRSSLAQPFAAKAVKASKKGGVFVAIDEVQKIAERDMEEICHAVQAAKTAGANIAFVIAGLPAAYAKIRRYPGSTFVQRMRRQRLGMLGVNDTCGFLESMFALVPEIKVPTDTLKEMAEFSGGHPYLLQLVGSYAYEVVAESGGRGAERATTLTDNLVKEAKRRALGDYQENVLRNLLIGLREGTREYLRAMCDVSDEQSTASTADIAHALGRTVQECSSQRARIIDLQLAAPVSRGQLRFTLPYLPLAFQAAGDDYAPDSPDTWIPRKTPKP